MQAKAAEYLNKNYPPYRSFLVHEEYCPRCLSSRAANQYAFAYHKPKVDRTKTWNEAFNDGVDPMQAVLYCNHLKTNRNFAKILKPGQHGEQCAPELECYERCVLCFNIISSASVTLPNFPESKAHKACCVKCSYPGCSNFLASIPATLLGGEPLPCLSMCDEHKDCKKEIVAPEPPVPTTTLLGFLGKRSAPPKPKTAQPQTDHNNRKRSFYNDPNAPAFASPRVRTPADPETFYGRRKGFDFTPPASSAELPK
jgi:hypothetical protein